MAEKNYLAKEMAVEGFCAFGASVCLVGPFELQGCIDGEDEH